MLHRLPLIFSLFIFSCSAQRMIETNLYFGQSKPGGGTITETEWTQFKEDHISKVFKEGSTIVNVTGNWYDPQNRKLITEPTYKIIYLYKRNKRLSIQIDSLRYWYKSQFQQQSVLRIDKKVKASF